MIYDRYGRVIQRGCAYFISGKFEITRIFIISCENDKINFVDLHDGRVRSYSTLRHGLFTMTSDFTLKHCSTFTEQNLTFAMLHDHISGKYSVLDVSIYHSGKLLKLFKKGETLNL